MEGEDEKKTNFDVFFDAFLESHPGYSSDEAVTEMMQLYDDSAKMFASSLIGLRNFLSNYTQSTLPNDATEEEIDAYFAEHEFEKKDACMGLMDDETWASTYASVQDNEVGVSEMEPCSVYAAINEMSDYYHMKMILIPRQMVDIGYLEDGSTTYIFYDCTKCNRNSVNIKNEMLEDYGDLNADVLKQWLALYTTKDRNAGKPIRAGFTIKVGTDFVPMGKTPLTCIGMGYAVNMTDTKFVYNDTKKGIYLYYQPVSNAYTDTVVSTNQLFATGVLSAFAGAGVAAAIIALVQRKKKKQGLAA